MDQQLIPHYKQEEKWSCGASSMKMILSSLGIKISEEKLIEEMGSNETNGTWNKSFPKLAEKYKLNFIVNRDSTVGGLKKAVEEGYKIVVCYMDKIEETGHYSVVQRVGKKNIYFVDPWYGPDHKIKLSEFKRIWMNDPELDGEKRWFFGIKN